MATLHARPRTETGKGVARKMRSRGEVPAVAYGRGAEARALTVDGLELQRLLASINPETTIVDLEVEGGETVPTLIREIQRHPSRSVIMHVDFFQIRAGETLQIEVPIRLVGTPVGVSEAGGMLQEVLREISVEVLPRNIPTGVEIDVSGLELGDSVHVSDVSVPDATILNDPELVICTVTTPTVADLPEDEAAEEGVGEVEPELVGSEPAEDEPDEA